MKVKVFLFLENDYFYVFILPACMFVQHTCVSGA